MHLRPFLLDQWIASHADADLPFNLAGSTGPSWTIDELLHLEDGGERRLLGSTISYQPSAGRTALRGALAEMGGVGAEHILVTTGAAEALFHVFFQAATRGANVIVPLPGFPPYHAIPEALGLEVRTYGVLASGGFDLDAITSLTDSNTRIIVVNSPHNPTGATISDQAMRTLHDCAVSRSVQLVFDEVFHPIYHGQTSRSASTLPHATVIGDLSKAFSLPGLRVGWIREPDPARRSQYINAREYLSVSNNVVGEVLAEIAVTHRSLILRRTQEVTSVNLAVLDSFMRDRSSRCDWSRPRGGTTAFIRFRGIPNTRPFCEDAAKRGLLLVPGDCFGFPDHVRVGLGVRSDVFARAMDLLADLVQRNDRAGE